MTNTAGKPKEKAKGAPLRTVFKRCDRHYCGMCREDYATIALAKQCLNKCFNKMILENPIKTIRGTQKNKYRCQICLRDHNSKPHAEACMTSCIADRSARVQLEEAITGIELPPPVRKQYVQKQKVTAKPQPKFQLQRGVTEEAVQEEPPPPTPVEKPKVTEELTGAEEDLGESLEDSTSAAA